MTGPIRRIYKIRERKKGPGAVHQDLCLSNYPLRFTNYFPKCMGIQTYKYSSFPPIGRMTPGLVAAEVCRGTLGVLMTLSPSTRYLTLKAISTAWPSTVASISATLSPVSAEVAEMETWPGTRSVPGLILMRAVWAASRAKMSEVRQALRNSSVGMMVRVV